MPYKEKHWVLVQHVHNKSSVQSLTSVPAPVYIITNGISARALQQTVLCDCAHVPSLWSLTYVVFFLRGIHGPLETTLTERALSGSIDHANCNSRLKPTAELHALVSKTPMNRSWENAWTPALCDSRPQSETDKGGGNEGRLVLMLLLFSSLHTTIWKQEKRKDHNSQTPNKTRGRG